MRLERATTQKSNERGVHNANGHQTRITDDQVTDDHVTDDHESPVSSAAPTATQPAGTEWGKARTAAETLVPSAELDRFVESGWRPPRRSFLHRATKRAIDIPVSLLGLILLSPVFMLIAIAIKFDGLGPVLYAQTRVGRGGRHFRFFKFRTMIPNADAMKSDLMELNHFEGDVTFKLTHDPRVTTVGRFLRTTSLDELPQLWNVLVGDMTLVGPRPAVPSEVAEYSDYELRRVAVVPGLTCYWQVSGRSDLNFEQQIALDLEYIENESLWLDFVLLARTIPALLSMKGAY